MEKYVHPNTSKNYKHRFSVLAWHRLLIWSRYPAACSIPTVYN